MSGSIKQDKPKLATTADIGEDASTVILDVKGLTIQLTTRRGSSVVVDDISFSLRKGSSLGLIGESGSGKTITGLALIGLLQQPALKLTGGSIMFQGKDLAQLSPDELREYRGRHLSMVLQDPLSALNPVLSIADQVSEPLRLHQKLRGQALRSRTIELLRMMKISSPEARLKAYPHQLSGGMRQRVVGSIALSGAPEVIIADEPTTALDVTVQAAYIALLKEIQAQTGLSILFITHDFAVVRDLCQDVVVMYAGRLVETGTAKAVFSNALHPYTKALLRSLPNIRTPPKRLVSIPGTPPSVFAMPSGCRFHTRCWLYEKLGCPALCRDCTPRLTAHPSGQAVACHFFTEAGGLL